MELVVRQSWWRGVAPHSTTTQKPPVQAGEFLKFQIVLRCDHSNDLPSPLQDCFPVVASVPAFIPTRAGSVVTGKQEVQCVLSPDVNQ